MIKLQEEAKIKRWLWFLFGFVICGIILALIFIPAWMNYYTATYSKVCIDGEWFQELVRDFNWSKYG